MGVPNQVSDQNKQVNELHQPKTDPFEQYRFGDTTSSTSNRVNNDYDVMKPFRGRSDLCIIGDETRVPRTYTDGQLNFESEKGKYGFNQIEPSKYSINMSGERYSVEFAGRSGTIIRDANGERVWDEDPDLGKRIIEKVKEFIAKQHESNVLDKIKLTDNQQKAFNEIVSALKTDDLDKVAELAGKFTDPKEFAPIYERLVAEAALLELGVNMQMFAASSKWQSVFMVGHEVPEQVVWMPPKQQEREDGVR